jgi:hypothetical protein
MTKAAKPQASATKQARSNNAANNANPFLLCIDEE